ncbi:hypothetical protein ACWCXH_22475 [Kitasatospora sp. NPDC001660]
MSGYRNTSRFSTPGRARDPQSLHRLRVAGPAVISLGGLLWPRMPVRPERAAPIPAQFPSAPA